MKKVFGLYNEPMLNLHQLNPFLKNDQSSLNAYNLIFELIETNPDKFRSLVLSSMKFNIIEVKEEILETQ